MNQFSTDDRPNHFLHMDYVHVVMTFEQKNLRLRYEPFFYGIHDGRGWS